LFDVKPNEDGLLKVLKDWQEVVFRYLWKRLEASGPTYNGERTLNIWNEADRQLKKQGKSISRASIINFCQAMEEAGYLVSWETTGKGGVRKLYKPSHRARNEKEFMEAVMDWILIGFQEQYPVAVYNAVSEHYRLK
jgi:hypothetical protein